VGETLFNRAAYSFRFATSEKLKIQLRMKERQVLSIKV